LRGPGARDLDWDTHDEQGGRVARGASVLRLAAGTTSLARKAVILRQ